MIKIGSHHRLKITKALDFGFFVDAENYGEILLPKKHAPKGLTKGEWVEVFLYLDTDDRPVATTQQPKAKVGEFAFLEAIDSNKVGAFLDWGLDKDLFLPFGEQHRPIEVGKFYLVYLYIDKVDSRITASSKIDKFLDYDKPHYFKANDPVNLIIANSTDLGYKAIINNGYWGMLYKNEVHQQLSFGQRIDGFIHQTRENNRIDLRLKSGEASRNQDEQKILHYLEGNNGSCHLNDKSDPKEISDVFGMSKGAFKKTIGRLYKQKIIQIKADGIQLVTS